MCRTRLQSFVMLIAVSFCCMRSYSQTKTQIPEYFGVYATTGGRLISLKGKNADPNVKTEPISGWALTSGGRGESGLMVQPDLHFVVFDTAASDIIRNLKFYKLPFIRNNIQGNIDMPIMGTGGGRTQIQGINKLMFGRVSEYEIGLLGKPLGSQPQMVELVPERSLAAGAYVLFSEEQPLKNLGPWWRVFLIGNSTEAQQSDCVDISFSGGGYGGMIEMHDYLMQYGPPEMPFITKSHYRKCQGGPLPSAVKTVNSIPDSGTSGAPQQPLPSSAMCGDFNACSSAGSAALNRKDFQTAISDLRRAVVLSSSDSNAWKLLGMAFLESGDPQSAYEAFDAALASGATLDLPLCRARFLACENGILALSKNHVAFRVKQADAFAASVADFSDLRAETAIRESVGTPHRQLTSTQLHLKVSGKNFNLFYRPTSSNCFLVGGGGLGCEGSGAVQQKQLTDYIVRTIPRLDAMDFKLPGYAVTSASKCSGAKDQQYSILHVGNLYKVKSIALNGKDVPLFVDDKGSFVSEGQLVHDLTAASWVRDNIVRAADLRHADARVGAILDTSKHLQVYQTTQDFLVRADIEALLAAATGGSSLSKTVPKATWGFVRSQLSDPQLWLNGVAWVGLQQSQSFYQELEKKLPAPDAAAFDSGKLNELRDLEERANILELACGGLATALMPTSGRELTKQAWSSAVSELTPRLPPSKQEVTLQGLFDLDTGLASLNGEFDAGRKYQQGLNLAINLKRSREKMISELAASSSAACHP